MMSGVPAEKVAEAARVVVIVTLQGAGARAGAAPAGQASAARSEHDAGAARELAEQVPAEHAMPGGLLVTVPDPVTVMDSA